MSENTGASDRDETARRDAVESEVEEALVGECTECGQVYSLQTGVDGTVVPLGTDGTCQCGNDEFEPLSETSDRQ